MSDQRGVLEIIARRGRDGRSTSFRRLARELDISETAACGRLQRLWRERLIAAGERLAPGTAFHPHRTWTGAAAQVPAAGASPGPREGLAVVIDPVSLEGPLAGGIPTVPQELPAFREQLLTLREVAGYLRVHERTVRRWVAQEGLPCIHLGARLRFSARNVLRWVSAREEGR